MTDLSFSLAYSVCAESITLLPPTCFFLPPPCCHELPGVSPSLVQRLSGQCYSPLRQALPDGTRSASAPNLLILDNTSPLPAEAETGRRGSSERSLVTAGAVAVDRTRGEEQLFLDTTEEGQVSQRDAVGTERNRLLGGQVWGNVRRPDGLSGSDHSISTITKHRSLPRRSLEPVAEDVPWTSDTAVVQPTAGRKGSWGGEMDVIQLSSQGEIQPADVLGGSQIQPVTTQTGRAPVNASGNETSATNPRCSPTVQHLRRLRPPSSSSSSHGAALLPYGTRDQGSSSPRTPATRATLVIPDFVWETYIPDTVDVHAAGRHLMQAAELDSICDLMNPLPTPAARQAHAKRVTVTFAADAMQNGHGTETGMGGRNEPVCRMLLVPSTMKLFKEQMSNIFGVQVDKILCDGYAEIDSVDVIRDGDNLLIVAVGVTAPSKCSLSHHPSYICLLSMTPLFVVFQDQ